MKGFGIDGHAEGLNNFFPWREKEGQHSYHDSKEWQENLIRKPN